jgi:ABC-type branched-subunit amino acid transport system substrate-binding protein
MRRTAVVLAALLSLTAACGARWTDDQHERVAARDNGGESAEAASETDAEDIAAGDGASTDGAAAGAVAGAGAAAGGGGGATGGGQAASARTETGGARPCAAASNAPGVTNDRITVGEISTLSGPSPGIGASAAAAARAYVGFRNATGGVCGRRIVLKEADDAFDGGRYRTILNEFDPQVLGLAGGFGTGDVGAVDVAREKKMPMVILPSADSVTALPNVFDLNPPYKNPDAAIGKYKYLYESGARKVAAVYIAVDQSRAEAQLQQRLMKAAGLQIVQVQELPLSTLSYDSAARSVANSGADYLFFIAPLDGDVAMAKSMADTGYKLKFAEYFVFAYGTNFVEQAGAAAEGTSTWLRALPNEDASSNKEMAAFVEWMERVAPGEPTDSFAADSWVAAKAFFDTLSSLPGPISRDALIAGLRSTKTYDAGGMMGQIQLGEELHGGCFVGLRVDGGKWKRMAPATGFLC